MIGGGPGGSHKAATRVGCAMRTGTPPIYKNFGPLITGSTIDSKVPFVHSSATSKKFDVLIKIRPSHITWRLTDSHMSWTQSDLGTSRSMQTVLETVCLQLKFKSTQVILVTRLDHMAGRVNSLSCQTMPHYFKLHFKNETKYVLLYQNVKKKTQKYE